MARNVNPETIAMARRFVEKFGHADITVNDLDMFLTDEGILPSLDFDPEQMKATGEDLTAEQKAQWNGFVQARANGRNMLNRGGRQLANGEAFMLTTLKSGDSYAIRKFTEAAKDYAATEMAEKVNTFARGRLAEFYRLKRQLDWQMDNNLLEDLDSEFLEVKQMYGILETQAQLLGKRVLALTLQYNRAVDAAIDQAKVLLEYGGTDVPMLEDKSDDD